MLGGRVIHFYGHVAWERRVLGADRNRRQIAAVSVRFGDERLEAGGYTHRPAGCEARLCRARRPCPARELVRLRGYAGFRRGGGGGSSVHCGGLFFGRHLQPQSGARQARSASVR
jgi:hypothetical protein